MGKAVVRRIFAILAYAYVFYTLGSLPEFVVIEYWPEFRPLVILVVFNCIQVLFGPGRQFWWSHLTPEEKVKLSAPAPVAPVDAGAAAMMYLAQNGMRAVALTDFAGRTPLPPAPTATPQEDTVVYVSPRSVSRDMLKTNPDDRYPGC